MKISAAISPCPNDIFIFAGLISGAVVVPEMAFDFSFHDLETLNIGAQENRWDLAKISYANFAFCEAGYHLLRCGGALGRRCGPLLLSNREGWDAQAEVLVPGKHTTANFLLDFFGKHGGGGLFTQKRYTPFDTLYRRLRGAEPCQGVVIHEMRFTYAKDGLHLVRDLGAYWETTTGYPIPLGAVALSKAWVSAHQGMEAPITKSGTVESAIRTSLNWSKAHPTEALDLCRQYSQSMSDAVLQSHVALYVNAFTYDIGDEGDAAVQYFLSQHRETVSPRI